jgi:hypothetical protein
MVTICIVHGTRRRLVKPDLKIGERVDATFHKALVNGENGLITGTKIINHQKVRFFVPDKH